MWDSTSGKSRGYGFVAFRDRSDADQCIETMNGRLLGNRAIRCNWANQKVSSTFSSGTAGGGGGHLNYQQHKYLHQNGYSYNQNYHSSSRHNSGSSLNGHHKSNYSHLHYVPTEGMILFCPKTKKQPWST